MKAKLDAIWNSERVQNQDKINIWTDFRIDKDSTNMGGVYVTPGAERAPTVGKSAEKFMRRVRKHWGPPPMAYCGDAKMIMPDWLRDNYKRNCPNNYKTLIAEYGKGVTKLDLAVTALTFFAAFGHAPRNGA
jgi:GH25 family lysozyme M1 (1,4-beta-N-acetylmuramidase)